MTTALSKPSFSYSRTYRLTTKADFSAVFDEGQKLSQAWFLALYKKTQADHPRLGVVISKRIIKKATARNYLKRRLREGFRAHRGQLPSLDLVILARKGCKVDDKLKLQTELENLWRRLPRI